MTNSRNPQTRQYRLGLILVTASAVAWSTTGLFTRLIPLDSWTMLVWRGLFGAFGLLLVMVALEKRSALQGFRTMGWPGLLLALVGALGMLCFITALRHTTVAHVAIIYATVPFVAASLAWIVMGERPTVPAILASIVALGGVAVMVGFGGDGGLLGDLLAFAMTVSMAVIMVIARRHPSIPVMPAACLSALLSALAASPFSGALAITPTELGLLALFGLTNSALGMAFFTLGSRFLPAIETALIGSLDAPLAPIWVWLAFGERPGTATLTGGAIVFAAVLLHIIREARGGGASRSDAVIDPIPVTEASNLT
jgi:drug/metabolite transporter (DMT)-like permease